MNQRLKILTTIIVLSMIVCVSLYYYFRSSKVNFVAGSSSIIKVKLTNIYPGFTLQDYPMIYEALQEIWGGLYCR